MNELESKKILQGILCGAQEVINKKAELNRINVFPVADGDTGSNLATLMQTMIDQVSIDSSVSIKEGFSQLAEASLVGARGNSGMIFAQYLYGFQKGLSEPSKMINQQVFIQATREAANQAYEAVLNPKEGTILSVMRSWSEALEQHFTKPEMFKEALTLAKSAAEEAMKATQFQMAILKKNKLVDAGAKGFYYFISGLTEYICYGEIANVKEGITSINKQELNAQHEVTEMPDFRYCTEFIVKNSQCSWDELRKKIVPYGDSLVLIGDTKQAKIHIHTNHPEKLMMDLLANGEISYQKVDDMHLQYEVSRQPRSQIAIVTDSVADLPEDYIFNHQVHVLPLNLLIDEQNYLDKLTVDKKDLQKKLTTSVKMSTAQPSIKVIDSMFSFLEHKYQHVLVITVSSQLSGTYQLIKQRIKEKQLSSEWIQVVDSKLNSIAQGLLVQQAVELVEQEKSFVDVVQQVLASRERIFIYVAVADLTPMIRSGRIPQVLGKMAQKMSLHPIVTLTSSGEGKLIGGALTQAQSIKKITKKIQKLAQIHQVEKITLTHVFDEKAAQLWKKQLEKKAISVSEVIESSTSIAISAGQSSLAIAGIRRERLG